MKSNAEILSWREGQPGAYQQPGVMTIVYFRDVHRDTISVALRYGQNHRRVGFSRGSGTDTMSGMSILDEAAGTAAWGAGEMNRMAALGESFLFIIDAWAERWVVLETHRARALDIRWCLDGSMAVSSVRPSYSFRYSSVNRSRYAAGFNIIRGAQLNGETWLANLTFPSLLDTDLTLREFVSGARAPFRLFVPDTLAVFSPERFVRIDSRGRISSYPMKGTINAGEPNAVSAILADEKEAAEHVTIVDLIRNDIGMVARGVEVPRYRFITEVAAGGCRLLQVSSEVAGELGLAWKERVGTVFQTLLPAGSVTGAPKKRTAEIIREAECCDRGWYAGVFGYFDGRELDSAVSIRFVEREESGELIYKSGGGITINSDIEKEYDELQEKIYVPFT